MSMVRGYSASTLDWLNRHPEVSADKVHALGSLWAYESRQIAELHRARAAQLSQPPCGCGACRHADAKGRAP